MSPRDGMSLRGRVEYAIQRMSIDGEGDRYDRRTVERTTDSILEDVRASLLSTNTAGRRLAQGAMFPKQYDKDDEYKRQTDELAHAVIESALNKVMGPKP